MKRRIARVLLAFWAVIMWSGAAVAQTACPQGVGPGSAQCGPSGGVAAPARPSVTVVTRVPNWGAFVRDVSAGVIGTSIDHTSRRRATRAATARCKELGGTRCELVFAYDSCGVVAEPVDRDWVFAAILADLTMERAVERAMSECSQHNPGANCQVVYARCNDKRLVY